MKIRYNFLMCFITLAFLSCKDDESTPTGQYFPLASGNAWVYEGPYPFSATVTGQEKIFNDKPFKEVTIKSGTTTRFGYVRHDNGDYYSRGFLNNMNTLLAVTEEHELNILKEKAPVNTGWEQNIIISNKNYNFSYNIVSKDSQKSFNDQEVYNNVTQVQLTVLPEGGTAPSSIHDFYFARGIGLIAIKFQYAGETRLTSNFIN